MIDKMLLGHITAEKMLATLLGPTWRQEWLDQCRSWFW